MEEKKESREMERTKQQVLGDKLVELVSTAKEIIDYRYSGLELSEEGQDTLELLEKSYRTLKTQLEVVSKYMPAVIATDLSMIRARTKYLLGIAGLAL